MTDVRPAPGATAVVARPGPLPGAGQHGGGGSRHNRVWPRRLTTTPSAASCSRARRSTIEVYTRAKPSLSCEPVSGFEPLTCRLQDGCSAC